VRQRTSQWDNVRHSSTTTYD